MKKLILIILYTLIYSSCNKECTHVLSYHDNGQNKKVFIYKDCNINDVYTEQYYADNGQLIYEGNYINISKDGKCRTWSKEGVLTAIWNTRQGKTNGLVQCWYDTGIKSKVVNMQDGLENGLEKLWYENGEIESSCYYIQGKREGLTYEYSLDSNSSYVFLKGHYKNDKEEGEWQWYGEDSVLYSKSNYINGEREGASIIYFPNGKTNVIDIYLNDSVINRKVAYNWDGEISLNNGNGKIYLYYNNDSIKYIGNYVNSKENGICEWFHRNGKLKQTLCYENQHLSSMKTYYETGEFEYEADNLNSNRNSLTSWYYKNGQLEQSVIFKERLPMKVIKSFDINGNKRNAGTLMDGTGTWIKYKDNGKIDEIRTYKNGVILE